MNSDLENLVTTLHLRFDHLVVEDEQGQFSADAANAARSWVTEAVDTWLRELQAEPGSMH